MLLVLWDAHNILSIGNNQALTILGKSKPDASPAGTPACKKNTKKQKHKPAARSKDFTKAGLFHCTNGTATLDLFPSGMSKPLCGFFCFYKKKCSKPNRVCEFNHIRKWDNIPANDQAKILVHCHLSEGKKVWLDTDTFAKHRVTIPNGFSYLLGDSNGPKSAQTSS
jgi:hypothetical protein